MKNCTSVDRRSVCQLAICLLLAISSTSISARHIIGGEATYKCLGGDEVTKTFELTFTLYRDQFGGGAPFDDPAQFGMYVGTGNNWSLVRSFSLSPISETALNIDADDFCSGALGNIGTDVGVYVFEVDIEISESQSFQFAYQRCCRSNQVLNIIDPDVTGIAVTVELSPLGQQMCDNSPVFDELPPVVRCVSELFQVDCSVTDTDGDQVSYSFCEPLTAGGILGVNGTGQNECDGITPDPTNCPPPYEALTYKIEQGFTTTTPMGSNVGLDSSTGLIAGMQDFMGSFVVGVCATTFRAGEVISVVRRDFTLQIVSETTATKDLDKEESLKVYPNPATTEVLISNLQGQEVFSIIDTQGRVVHTGRGYRVDITNLAVGVYIVQALTSGRSTRFTVVR